MSAGRHRYLVAYDIRHPTRLRAVFKAMKGYGDHLQYSVFICDLRGSEKSAMFLHLAAIIDHSRDSVAIVDLGLADDRGRFCVQFLGAHPPLPEGGALIV